MGLLSRANTLDELKSNPGMAFSDFINKHSLKICTLLEKKASNYFVTNSIGFDAESILTATSTSDFWDGICKDYGQIYSFKDSEKTKLLQLFSFNLKDNFQVISVYKNKASQILISSEIITNEAAKDFETISNKEHENNYLNLNPLIKENSVVLLLKIDFSEAVKAYILSAQDKITEPELFNKSVINELYNRFSCRYNISDTTVKTSQFKLKTVIITNKEYSIELISHHIILNLKEVLQDNAELTQICFSGTAASCEKIQSFLQVE